VCEFLARRVKGVEVTTAANGAEECAKMCARARVEEADDDIKAQLALVRHFVASLNYPAMRAATRQHVQLAPVSSDVSRMYEKYDDHFDIRSCPRARSCATGVGDSAAADGTIKLAPTLEPNFGARAMPVSYERETSIACRR